ncbi:MAG TPA: BTAD domain-containing putative transcriptional regulator [Nocardioidaceae bacterium]|nr:BTAD domain-containing putative transcriptional regulator [Nocardioidaceae bacterium]
MTGLRTQERTTSTGLRVHALGSVQVTKDGTGQGLGGPRQRRLLAALLVHADQVVSVDRLAEVVFAGEPTPAAATTLRSYVARLRRVLGNAVVTRSPGYQLTLAELSFDVVDFEAGVEAGRTALSRREPAVALERLRGALGLWEGEPYAEFADEPWAHPEASRLAELRMAAHELLVDAELGCGRAREVLPAIEALCRQHPLREAFRAQLMTAYYHVGRQADALSVLREFREELVEELGIDPSPRLVDLERRILAQDPSLQGATTEGEPLRGYRLGERLGTGRSGTVHAATLPGVDRAFAVKSLRPDIADDPDFIRSFEAIAHRVASLRHPAVARLHDWWRGPGVAYVVMPRLPGRTLRDRLRGPALARAEIATLVARVGGALTEAAGCGLVHGRITADNVLYDGDGEPVLADFWLGWATAPSSRDDVCAFAALVGQALRGTDVPAELAALLRPPEGTAVEDLTRQLLTAIGAQVPPAPARNPYQGLRAFDEADAENYFGRTTLIDDVLTRLSGDGLRSRLVLLVGASGTGKSSAVRAGLLPRLRGGGAPGSDAWFVATMLPGGAPYEELATSLHRIAVGGTDRLVEQLPGLEGIDRSVRAVVPGGGELLLVIDQLEELFTLSPESERRRFLEALSHALTVAESRLRVVATLRADYYDRPLASQPFGSLVQNATVTIPAMSPAEVEAAVVEPAQRAGRTVERALAVELVASLAAEPAALPALQLVLFELAEGAPDGHLSLSAYSALGGIEGAIAARAEELYQSLEQADREQVRVLFERLVVVAADGEPTRRRAQRDELATPGEVVDRWAAARLLTLDVDPHTRVPTVEVAHEALVREWPRLRRWLEDDRSRLVVLRRVRESAATWEELGREPSALLRGTALEAALELFGRTSIAPVEVEYIEASRAARDAEQTEQAAVIARQARSNKRLKVQVGATAVALVVALVGGLLALDQRGRAVRERHVAVARELAASADSTIRDDPELSILLALAAVDATRRHDEPVLPEAVEALHRGVASARILRSFAGVGGTMDWSHDGRLFVTEGREESGAVDIRSATTGETVRKFRGDSVDINDAVFSADSKQVVTAGDEGAVRVWDIATARLRRDVTIGSGGATWGPSISPDGRMVAGAWPEQNEVRVFRVAGGRPWVIPVEYVLDTAFSPDGRHLAVASSGPGKVHVFHLGTRRRVLSFGETEGIRDLAWSPDGRRIAVATSNSDAGVYDARTGRLQLVTPAHTGPANGVAWSPDSKLLATAADDGTARVYAVEERTARERIRLAAHDMRNGVRSVAFSPDGGQLMTSDWAITSVKVWDVREQGAAEVANVPGEAWTERGAALTPDGRFVWVPEGAGRLARYDLATGRLAQRLPAPPVGEAATQHVALSPDGRLLAASSWVLPFPVWDTRTGDVAFVVGEGGAGVVWALEWAPSGNYLGVAVTPEGSSSSQVRLLDRGGTQAGRISGEPEVEISSLAFGEDDAVLATTGRTARDDPARQAIRLWDWRKDTVIRRLEGNALAVAFDPTGHLLASSRLIQGVVDVWDARTGDRVSTLEGHTATVSDLAFDASGDRVATSGVDGSVRVWDPRSGRLQVTLELGVPVGGAGVAFSPDGRWLVTTWLDGMTRVWTLDLDELVGIGRERVTRGFTTAECRQYLHVDSCPDA